MKDEVVIVKRVIQQSVDDPNRMLQFSQMFLVGRDRPVRDKPGPVKNATRDAEFFRETARVAGEIADVLENGAVFITSLDNGMNPTCIATPELAQQRILQGSHRLATSEEIKKLKAAK